MASTLIRKPHRGQISGSTSQIFLIMMPEEHADRADLARQTEARDALDKTVKALQEVAEGDRAALLMRALDEMSYEEISAALGISIAAVKTRIFRARLKLAEIQETLQWKS